MNKTYRIIKYIPFSREKESFGVGINIIVEMEDGIEYTFYSNNTYKQSGLVAANIKLVERNPKEYIRWKMSSISEHDLFKMLLTHTKNEVQH